MTIAFALWPAGAAVICAAPPGLSAFAEALCWFAAWAFGSILAAKAVALAWRWILLPTARRRQLKLQQAVLESMRAPAQWAVFTAGLSMGAHASFQGFPQITGHVAWITYVGAIYVALVASVTIALHAATRALTEWYRAGIATRTPGQIDDQFIALLQKASKFLFVFLALTVILDHFGIQITGLLATAGVASLAIAFAAQETLSNMISGFVLMVDRPFQVGDRIELANGKGGDVSEVGLRSTRILSYDDTVITIPNSDIAKNQITNLSAPTPRFRLRIRLGIAYSSDVRKAKRILLEIFAASPDVLKTPPPAVYLNEFGDSALILLYVCWIREVRDELRVRDELNMAIHDRFGAEGIEIPFPQHDVHVRTERIVDARSQPGRPGAVAESG